MKKLFWLIILLVLIPFTGYAYTIGSPPTMLPPAYSSYAPNSAAADQGVTSTAYVTLKNLVDAIGATDQATIILSHSGATAQTTYTLTTNESVPANQMLYFENGAIIDGAGTITLDSPEQIIASPNQQIFGATITVTFTYAATVYPEWWGQNTTPGTTDMTAEIQAALNASTSIVLQDCLYKTSSALSITSKNNIQIIGLGRGAYIRNTGAGNVLTLDTINVIVLRNIGIHSDGANAGHGIQMTTVTFPRFENVTVYNTEYDCVNATSTINGSFIGCNFSTPGTGYSCWKNLVGSNQNAFHGCKFTVFAEIGYNHDGGVGVIFNGCDFSGSGVGIDVDGGHTVSVDGCYFEALNKSIEWGSATTWPTGLSIENSYFSLKHADGAIGIDFIRGSSSSISGGFFNGNHPTHTSIAIQVGTEVGGVPNCLNIISPPYYDDITTKVSGIPAVFATDDATPSVDGGSIFKTANANATTITAFDVGQAGQQIKVIIGDANTTIDFTATTLKGNVGVDWTPASGDWLEGVFDGTNWYCSCHDTTA